MVNTPSGNHPNALQLRNLFAQFQALVSNWDKVFLSEEYKKIFLDLLRLYLIDAKKQDGIYQEDILEEIVKIMKLRPLSVEVSITENSIWNMKSLNLNILGYVLSYQFKTEGNIIRPWEHNIALSKCATFWFMYGIANDYFIAYENIIREYQQSKNRKPSQTNSPKENHHVGHPVSENVATDVASRVTGTLNLSSWSRVMARVREMEQNTKPTK